MITDVSFKTVNEVDYLVVTRWFLFKSYYTNPKRPDWFRSAKANTNLKSLVTSALVNLKTGIHLEDDNYYTNDETLIHIRRFLDRQEKKAEHNRKIESLKPLLEQIAKSS